MLVQEQSTDMSQCRYLALPMNSNVPVSLMKIIDELLHSRPKKLLNIILYFNTMPVDYQTAQHYDVLGHLQSP